MSIAIITGSGGLIGAESVKFFSKKFDKLLASIIIHVNTFLVN